MGDARWLAASISITSEAFVVYSVYYQLMHDCVLCSKDMRDCKDKDCIYTVPSVGH